MPSREQILAWHDTLATGGHVGSGNGRAVYITAIVRWMNGTGPEDTPAGRKALDEVRAVLDHEDNVMPNMQERPEDDLNQAHKCAADLFPQAALNAMVQESGRPVHDDGHTDCYYAGLLLAALPHLVTDEAVERAAHELYAAGPWGDIFTFTDHGARCITDAHTIDVYREMVRDVLTSALHWQQQDEGEGRAGEPSDDDIYNGHGMEGGIAYTQPTEGENA